MAAARLAYQFTREATQRRNAGARAQDREKGKSTAKAAAQYGVSPRLVELAKKVLNNGVADLVRAVEEGEISISDAANAAKELPEVQPQAVNAVLSGRAKRATEAVELCRVGNQNGQTGQSVQTAAPSYDETALAKFYDDGFRLLYKLQEDKNRHPGLMQAVEHLVASRRAFELWIRFPSPDACRQHLRGW